MQYWNTLSSVQGSKDIQHVGVCSAHQSPAWVESPAALLDCAQSWLVSWSPSCCQLPTDHTTCIQTPCPQVSRSPSCCQLPTDHTHAYRHHVHKCHAHLHVVSCLQTTHIRIQTPRPQVSRSPSCCQLPTDHTHAYRHHVHKCHVHLHVVSCLQTTHIHIQTPRPQVSRSPSCCQLPTDHTHAYRHHVHKCHVHLHVVRPHTYIYRHQLSDWEDCEMMTLSWLQRHQSHQHQQHSITLQKSYSLSVLLHAAPALTFRCRQIEELNACWNGVFRKHFGYSRFESVKQVIHGLGRLNVKHMFMLRKIEFYRHLYLSLNFLHNLLCVCLVHNVDDCMKSVFLPMRVAIETVKLSFVRMFMIDCSFYPSLYTSVSLSIFLPCWRINVFIITTTSGQTCQLTCN